MGLVKRYENLVNAFKDDTDTLDFMAERLAKMPEYVNKRVQHILYSFTHSGGASRDANVLNRLSELDTMRNSAHETAINACQQLNRLCASVDLEPIFTGDINNREDVALFASEVTIEFFDNEKMYRRTSPEKLVDDMVFDKYQIDTKDQSIERICENAGIDCLDDIEYNERE